MPLPLPIPHSLHDRPPRNHFKKPWSEFPCYPIDVAPNVFFSFWNIQNDIKQSDLFKDGRLQIVVQDFPLDTLSDGWIYASFESKCHRWLLFFYLTHNARTDPKFGHITNFITPYLSFAFRGMRRLCRAHPFRLTRREYEILNWIKTGKTTWEMAQIMSVTESCINFHIENIKKKFEAVNRTQAVVMAMKNGLV